MQDRHNSIALIHWYDRLLSLLGYRQIHHYTRVCINRTQLYDASSGHAKCIMGIKSHKSWCFYSTALPGDTRWPCWRKSHLCDPVTWNQSYVIDCILLIIYLLVDLHHVNWSQVGQHFLMIMVSSPPTVSVILYLSIRFLVLKSTYIYTINGSNQINFISIIYCVVGCLGLLQGQLSFRKSVYFHDK